VVHRIKRGEMARKQRNEMKMEQLEPETCSRPDKKIKLMPFFQERCKICGVVIKEMGASYSWKKN